MLGDVDQTIEYRPPLIADNRFMQLATVAIPFVVLKPGPCITDFIFHRHRQTVQPKRGVFAVKLRTGVMAQYRITKQETVANGSSIRAQLNVIMREVVAEGIFERQFDMAQMGVCRDVHR